MSSLSSKNLSGVIQEGIALGFFAISFVVTLVVFIKHKSYRLFLFPTEKCIGSKNIKQYRKQYNAKFYINLMLTSTLTFCGLRIISVGSWVTTYAIQKSDGGYFVYTSNGLTLFAQPFITNTICFMVLQWYQLATLFQDNATRINRVSAIIVKVVTYFLMITMGINRHLSALIAILQGVIGNYMYQLLFNQIAAPLIIAPQILLLLFIFVLGIRIIIILRNSTYLQKGTMYSEKIQVQVAKQKTFLIKVCCVVVIYTIAVIVRTIGLLLIAVSMPFEVRNLISRSSEVISVVAVIVLLWPFKIKICRFTAVRPIEAIEKFDDEKSDCSITPKTGDSNEKPKENFSETTPQTPSEVVNSAK